MSHSHRIALFAALFFPSILPAMAAEADNKISVAMIDIPAGSFQMGACQLTVAKAEEDKKRRAAGETPRYTLCDPAASSSEVPVHPVNVAAFQLGKTEVTLGQFKKFISAARRKDLDNDSFKMQNRFGDDAPVVMVSWNDAQAFIAWLNRTSDGAGYRLPTEAEWEYACGAGGNPWYCGGEVPGHVAWYSDIAANPSPVGRKRANGFGLYDMSGNASEWVQDCWHDNYRGAPAEGKVWVKGGDCKYRVLRGGSWNDATSGIRSTSREKGTLDERHSFVGFRLARTIK